MLRFVIIALLLLLGVGAWLYFSGDTSPVILPSAAKPKILPPPPRTTPDGPVILLPVAQDAGVLNSPATTAADDLSHLGMLLGDYRRNHGGNPVGENDEIAAALLGRNPKRLGYLPAKGSFLNDKGQLIDRWSTPYFFHALSGSQMEIRSAGPDRTMHTADDVLM